MADADVGGLGVGLDLQSKRDITAAINQLISQEASDAADVVTAIGDVVTAIDALTAAIVGPQSVSIKYISTATTTLVKTGAGTLYRVIIGKQVAAQTVSLYDAVTATNQIGQLTTDAIYAVDFGAAFSTGLTVVTSGATPISVIYA